MRDKILEIHEALVGNFAAKFKEGNWWGHDTDLGEQKEAFDQAAQAILDLLDKSLPGSKPFGKGYNQALADVRKVIKEDKMSNCCNAQVYDPSGLGIEGRCKDCLEMCLIVKEAE